MVVAVACGNDHGPPPNAPVAVDIAPARPITSGPLAQSPPPNPERPESKVAAADAAEGEPSEPAPSPMPPPPGGATKSFDRGAAAAALTSAQISRCSVPGGPTGHGHVTVVWDPSGRVASVTVDQGPFPGTAVGGCLARVYSTATVPPFAGAPVRVGKSFTLP